MKSVKPVFILSFFFFASILASDVNEPITNNLANYNDNDELDFTDDEDYDEDYVDDNDEDIIYSRMVSAKPSPTPPPAFKLPSSPSLVKTPTAPPTTICKKWRCTMNGYTPVWTSKVSSYCKDNYAKLGIMAKASCQDQFCEKVCEKF